MDLNPPLSNALAPALATSFRAVLLDDDAQDRDSFRQILRRHPAIQLVGETGSLREALGFIARERVDVLFLETQLAGKPILDECHLIPAAVKMIFVTRHHAAAVRAFELEAVDFLVKPLAAPRFSETIRRLLRIDWSRPTPFPGAPPSDGTLLIPFERGRRGISIDEMALIQAFGNYTRVSLGKNRSEIVLRSLAKWEKILPMPPFLRVHRNTIVHARKVCSLEESGGGIVLRLEGNDEPIPVSRRCLPEVRQALFAFGI